MAVEELIKISKSSVVIHEIDEDVKDIKKNIQRQSTTEEKV